MAEKKGKCFLVGAGPGDLGLVTLRAKECVERAEVIVYDYLCNPEMLRWAPEAAELIFAGKKAGAHTLTQEQINALLVEKTREGKNVVRLKGGDPFLFGRGGEEAHPTGIGPEQDDVAFGEQACVQLRHEFFANVVHHVEIAESHGHEMERGDSRLDFGEAGDSQQAGVEMPEQARPLSKALVVKSKSEKGATSKAAVDVPVTAPLALRAS